MKSTFIYALKCPTTGLIRYVGKSDTPKKRFVRHLLDARNGEVCHRANWIRSVLAQNHKPILEIIDEVEDGFAEGLPLEAAYIQFFLDEGCDLTNATPGGDGFSGGENHPCFGRTGKKHPCFGKKLTAEHRAKIGRKEEENGMFGRKHSEEARVKIKAKRAAQIFTEGHNIKKSLSHFGQKQSNNTSGFVGVSRHAKKWCAELSIFKKKTHLGRFSKLEDAVFVRNLAAALV